MKRVILNYLVIAALAILAACTSNKMDDTYDRKGVGILNIKGQDHPIIGAGACSTKDGSGNIRSIHFKDKNGRTMFFLIMKEGQKLTAKSYTANEIELLNISPLTVDGGDQADHAYWWDGNVVMKVGIKGNTYNITITGNVGQTTKDEYEYTEYTLNYEGKILVEDCVP